MSGLEWTPDVSIYRQPWRESTGACLRAPAGEGKTMTETEWEYGCCRCQTYHAEGDGPVYAEHLMWQSKHGLRRRPKGGWVVTGAAR
jgi:hypothetical protein